MRRSPMPARTVPQQQQQIRRRVRAELAESIRLYRAAWPIVDARSGGHCELCGVHPADQHHHRKARQAGGSVHTAGIHSPANLLHVCSWCHQMAEEHPDRWTFGWKVHRGHDPAAVPVLLTVGEGWAAEPSWYLLGGDGSRSRSDHPEMNRKAAADAAGNAAR